MCRSLDLMGDQHLLPWPEPFGAATSEDAFFQDAESYPREPARLPRPAERDALFASTLPFLAFIRSQNLDKNLTCATTNPVCYIK
jgi:hypothetical protein